MTVASVRRIHLAIANLFDLLPAAQQFNAGGTGSDIAMFRSRVLSIKEAALRNAAEAGGKKTNPQSPLPLAADYSQVSDHIGGSPSQTTSNVWYTRGQPTFRSVKGSILRDLALCLHDIEEWQNMKTDENEKPKGYTSSNEKHISS